MSNYDLGNAWMRRMFDSVPEKYAFLNTILTFGQDGRWRRKALSRMELKDGGRVLDICTGTGDIALKIKKRFPDSKVYGLDFSYKMLVQAKARATKRNMRDINFVECDCANMGFLSNLFDCVTISFGFRNLSFSKENLKSSLREIHRVLKDGGKFIILETSQPVNLFVRRILHLYAKTFVPAIGRFLSGRKEPYAYLAASIVNFFDREKLNAALASEGFRAHYSERLFFGAILVSIFQK